jgi:hypothetical protein
MRRLILSALLLATILPAQGVVARRRVVAAGAGSTPAFVAGAPCVDQPGTLDTTCTASWTFGAGNSVIGGACTGTGATLTVSDTVNTYETVLDVDDTARLHCKMWRARTVTAGTRTITVTSSIGAVNTDGVFGEYSGLSAAILNGATSSAIPFNTGATVDWSSGATSSISSSSLVVGFAGLRGGSTLTETWSATTRQTRADSPYIVATISDKLASSGTQAATWHISADSSGIAMVAAFTGN